MPLRPALLCAATQGLFYLEKNSLVIIIYSSFFRMVYLPAGSGWQRVFLYRKNLRAFLFVERRGVNLVGLWKS